MKKLQVSPQNLQVLLTGSKAHHVRGRQNELYQWQAIDRSLTLQQVADVAIVFAVFQRNTKCAHNTRALARGNIMEQ